jgi:hypothetical protein
VITPSGVDVNVSIEEFDRKPNQKASADIDDERTDRKAHPEPLAAKGRLRIGRLTLKRQQSR